MKITHERLISLLSYDPDSGIFTRLKVTSPSHKFGEIVGSKHRTGYLYAMLDNVTYSMHHLAWFYSYEEWPKFTIDHINSNPSDNRIKNLRDIPQSVNCQNETKPRKNNTSGFLGVYFRAERNKWVAQLRVGGQQRRFGSFNTPEEAAEAYLKAKRLYHEGCTI